MDASGPGVLDAGGAAGEGDAGPADLLPRLDRHWISDLQLLCGCNDPGAAARRHRGVRSDPRGDALRLRRVRCPPRALDPEPRHTAAEAAPDVRVRPQGHQCLAAGVRRSVVLEPDPAAAI